MADLTHATIAFPAPPPSQPPKPVYAADAQPPMPDPFSLWGSHDPALFRDPATGLYYTYCTGAIARRSVDLITWETIGKVVEHPPKESSDWVGDTGIWAPDIIKVGGEYRLYCSNSTWGVRQSAIFLAVSDNAEGPFEPRGIVLKTSHDSLVNAIDANLIVEEESGDHYMAYGSFWGGMHIIKLDKDTGLAAEEGIGTCIARRPKWADGAIEGPYIRFNPDTGYYYLFVSYGSLKSDYNIRVGRSRTLLGPYLDPNGRDLNDVDDDRCEIGLMIAGGYRFGSGQGYMGPGHNSVLRDEDNAWYLACHIREHDFSGPQIATMHVHRILWTPNGWPVLNPQRYAGEHIQPIDKASIAGEYERIKLTPLVPQSVLNSVPMTLFEDGRFECCSIIGSWEQADDTSIAITYGNVVETCLLTPAWDWQRGVPTLALTGLDQFGVAVWASKI